MDLKKSELPEFGTLSPASGSGLAVSGNRNFNIVSKEPITSTLRELKIGAVAKFPWERRASVLVVANRLKKELARFGWDYAYSDDEDNFIVKILRIS